MARLSEALNVLKPPLAMLAYQAARAGANIFFSIAAFDGMSMWILIAYRFLFAAVFIIGLALIFERKNRPKLTWLVVGQAFTCGLLSCTMSQNFYAQGLVLTTGTFASAMYNLVPAFTYILAVSFRMEKPTLRTMAGQAKLAGTMVCIAGAMVLTFYKGPELNLWRTNFDILDKVEHKGGDVLKQNMVLGAILLVCSCISTAMGWIVQAKLLKNYPLTYSSTALMTTMAAIQSVVFALCMEKSDWSQWKLNRKPRLFAAIYNGIVATGSARVLAAWCVKVKGPLYVSVFNPLMLVFVAIAGSLVLDEKLHVGSVIGAVVIVLGLYLVLWGKAKEKRKAEVAMSSQSPRKMDSGEVIKGVSGDIECDEIKEEGHDGKHKNAERV